MSSPTIVPLIAYSTFNGLVGANFSLVIPAGYLGVLVDNPLDKRIDLDIAPNAITELLVWTGASNNDWDYISLNWRLNGVPEVYTNSRQVVFDDSALKTTVNLAGDFSPASMVMSNSLVDYTFSGPGSLTGANSLWLKGSRTTVLENAGLNTFTGDTIVSRGTLALAGVGSIANSAVVSLLPGATLDATRRTDGTLTLGGSQTLQGDGAVIGNLVEVLNSSVSPGGGMVGKLTVSGAATLGGTTYMDLSKLPLTNDVLQASSLVYGGTLVLSVLNGSLADADTFRLFAASDYSGAFFSIVPPIPYPGGAWDVSSLASDGILRVGPQPPPTIATPGDLTVACSGPGGTPVSFTVTAKDFLGNPIPIVCQPPSGTGFPVGRTPVHCEATDSAGNTATATFTITVTDTTPVSLSAAVQTGQLLLSWPETCSRYFLEASSTLDAVPPWTLVTAPISSSNGVNTVTLPLRPEAAFFRLGRSPALAFSQIDFELDDGYRPNSDWGAVDLTYVGTTNVQYFNLSVNGTWQVLNIPVAGPNYPGVAQVVTLSFRLSDYGVPVGNVHYDFSLTPFVATMPQGSAPPSTIVASVSDRQVRVFGGETPGAIVYNVATPLTGGLAVSVAGGITNFPNRDQGTNECVPGAVRNGLEYIGINTNDITMEKMKQATAWKTNGCAYGWWTNKDAYMKSNNLPVSTVATTNIADAVSALGGTNKAAVEIGVPGHRACVVKIVDHGGGKYTLTVAHDTQQGQPGGTKTEEVTYDVNTGKVSGGAGVFTTNSLRNFVIETKKN